MQIHHEAEKSGSEDSIFPCPVFLARDWPEFRGPTGQGLSDESGLPLTWSENRNVRWKTAIPGRGWSSPAIQGDQIWLTTATEEGKSLRAICVDRQSGAILQNIEVFRLNVPGRVNAKNSLASPTPVLDGNGVYVHFGAFGTACISQSGKILWRTRLEYDNGQHGPGGSPVLYENLLIVNCDGMSVQYVAALDKWTGRIQWKQYRKGSHAYSTPLIVRLAGGDQLISAGAFRVVAYEPRTGKEIWQVLYGDGFSNVPRPVFGNGLVFICTGFQQPSLLAVRVDGRGDVYKVARRLETRSRSAADAFAASGRRRAVPDQRQRNCHLRGCAHRKRVLAAAHRRESFRFASICRWSDLFSERGRPIGCYRAREGVQDTRHESTEWPDARFDGRVRRSHLPAQQFPSLLPPQSIASQIPFMSLSESAIGFCCASQIRFSMRDARYRFR